MIHSWHAYVMALLAVIGLGFVKDYPYSTAVNAIVLLFGAYLTKRTVQKLNSFRVDSND